MPYVVKSGDCDSDSPSESRVLATFASYDEAHRWLLAYMEDAAKTDTCTSCRDQAARVVALLRRDRTFHDLTESQWEDDVWLDGDEFWIAEVDVLEPAST